MNSSKPSTAQHLSITRVLCSQRLIKDAGNTPKQSLNNELSNLSLMVPVRYFLRVLQRKRGRSRKIMWPTRKWHRRICVNQDVGRHGCWSKTYNAIIPYAEVFQSKNLSFTHHFVEIARFLNSESSTRYRRMNPSEIAKFYRRCTTFDSTQSNRETTIGFVGNNSDTVHSRLGNRRICARSWFLRRVQFWRAWVYTNTG